MSALDTAFARTSAGDTELAHASRGLSLVQRKLLGLVSAETTLNQVHLNHVLHEDEVERSVARLLELGLIKPAGIAASTLPLRLDEPPRKSFSRVLPIVVTVVVLAGAGFWLISRQQGVRPPPTVPATVVEKEIADARPANSPSPDIKEPVSPVPAIDPAPAKASDSPARGELDSPKPAAKPGSPATAPAKDSAKPTAPNAAPNAAAFRALVDESKTDAKIPITRTEPPQPNRAAGKAVQSVPAAVQAVPQPAPVTSQAAPRSEPVAGQGAPQPSGGPAIDIAPAPPAAVAAARLAEPSPPPTSAQALAKVIYKETPSFPPEAVLQGVTSGNVKVRLNIDGKGAVSEVIIVESRPRKLFDKAVIRALNRWKFEPTGGPQIVETEVVFTVGNQ